MNQLETIEDWPDWVKSHSAWGACDERDFLVVMKAYNKFKDATGDHKIAAVLVMAWSTLQAKSRS